MRKKGKKVRREGREERHGLTIEKVERKKKKVKSGLKKMSQCGYFCYSPYILCYLNSNR